MRAELMPFISDTDIRKTFNEIDTDKDGFLSRTEVEQAVYASGYDTIFLEEFMNAFDADSDGKIDYTEFTAGILNLTPEILERERIRCHFRKLDKERNGRIGSDELESFLKERQCTATTRTMKKFISLMDKNQDGQIDEEEFIDFILEDSFR